MVTPPQSSENAKPEAPETLNSLKPAASLGSNLKAPEVFTFRFVSAFQEAKRFATMFMFALDEITWLVEPQTATVQ